MNLPRSESELTELFKNARTPEITEFRGEYFVDMITRLLSLKKLNHRKIFRPEKGGVSGHNLLLNKIV